MPAQAQEPASFIRADKAPPAGFEDLSGPQTTQVDVYFGGELLATTMARFDFEAVELLAPREVVDAIPRLLEPDTVLAALSVPLAHNADRICRYRGEQGCGVLAPAVAGVIFDENRFRIDLFVAAGLIEARALFQSRFLPEATADFSTLHMVSMSLSGGAALDNTGYSLGSTSLFAWRANRVHSAYDFSDDGFAMSELSWQRDRPGWQYEAGKFRSYSRGFGFIPEKTVIGGRVGGSLDTRADLDSADATPIFLFLNHAARVDIRRDDQLLDSRFYEAGNQQLDTTGLPDGAYDIRVIVSDSNGQQREQTYFFVRTARLPPLDQPLYFAEAGRLTANRSTGLPGPDDGNWLRLGTARRLQQNFGGEVELVHAAGTTLFQGGVFMLGPGWQFEAGVLGSTRGDTGALLRGAYRSGETTLGVDLRSIQSAAPDPGSSGFDVLPESYSQGNLTLSRPLFRGRLFVRAQFDQRGTGGKVTVLGTTYTRGLMRRPGFMLDLDVDATRDEYETVLRVGVQGRWRRDRYTAVVRPQLAGSFGKQGGGSALLIDASASRDARNTALGDVSSSIFAATEIDSRTVGAGVTLSSDLGSADVDVQHGSGEAGQGVGYAANARFNLVSDEGPAWGGRRSHRSAVIVDLGGDTATQFDVIVDDRAVATASSSRRNVVGLRPYDTYEIRIAPRGERFVEFDQRPQQVTLYPGNVEALKFSAQVVTVVVGQLVDDAGAPVANARFEGLSGYAGTDDNGWFQIEIATAAPFVVRRASAPTCRVELPPLDTGQDLVILDRLVCVTRATP